MVVRCWGDGPPLLLLHGGSGSWRHWARNIWALSRTYRLWAPDIPGFGDSRLRKTQEIVGFDAIAEALTEGLEGLRDTSSSLSAIGFSMGATLAVQLAALWQAPLRDLVLVGCNLVSPVSMRIAGLLSPHRARDDRTRRAAWRSNLALLMLADPGEIDESTLQAYIDDCVRRTLPLGAVPGDPSKFSALSSLRLSGTFLVVNGARDRFAPSKEEQFRAARSLRSDAHVHYIEGAGHWVQHERAMVFNSLLQSTMRGPT